MPSRVDLATNLTLKVAGPGTEYFIPNQNGIAVPANDSVCKTEWDMANVPANETIAFEFQLRFSGAWMLYSAASLAGGSWQLPPAQGGSLTSVHTLWLTIPRQGKLMGWPSEPERVRLRVTNVVTSRVVHIAVELS